ncbi:MAG: hypothetical protein CRN43_16950, partial [Candidatus Nephrothrix sp. EaCA]
MKSAQYLRPNEKMNRYSAYDDARLISAIRGSDKLAFLELCHRYWKPLMSKATRILPSHFDAEETVQDVFIWVWNCREKLHILNVESYLHTAMRHGCSSAFRHILRENKNWDYYKTFLPTEVDSVETNFINLEKGESIEELVSKLPSFTQQVFRMKIMEGLTFREIAAELNCSKKTIEYHLLKSKKLLKSELRQFMPVL